MKLLEVRGGRGGGHVPHCPIAGDATVSRSRDAVLERIGLDKIREGLDLGLVSNKNKTECLGLLPQSLVLQAHFERQKFTKHSTSRLRLMPTQHCMPFIHAVSVFHAVDWCIIKRLCY